MTARSMVEPGAAPEPREAAAEAQSMRVMMVVRLANGFAASIADGKWTPSGTPAIARLIERLDRGPEALRLIMTRGLAPGGNAAIPMLRSREKHLDGLRSPVTVLAEGPRAYSGAGFWLRELIHLALVWREARRFHPDVIYVDRSNVLTGSVLARFGCAPVVLRLMGVPPELRKILTGSEPARRLFRWAYRAPFAHVISTLEGSRAVDFMEAALDAEVPRTVMLNGVDAEPSQGALPAALEAVPRDRVVATFLGRLEALKGADFFVDALLTLAEEDGNSLHGLIVGDGAQMDDLKAKVAAAGADERVTFTGALPHDTVARALARSGLYVSLNRQGHLSNATLEAMAHGVPVVLQEIAGQGAGMDEFESLVPRQAYRAIAVDATPGDLAKELAGLAKAPAARGAMRKSLEAFARENLKPWDERIEREVKLLRKAAGREAHAVLMVIADLGSGGAQQVATNLANHWAKRGRRVGVVTWSDPETDFFKLDCGVERFALPDPGMARNGVEGIINNARRIRGLRRAMRAFGGAVILSFIAPTNVVAILAAAGLGRRVVICERNDPARQSFGRAWDLLRRLLYGRADLVTANSKRALETLKGYVPAGRLAHLPNPLREGEETKARAGKREKLFLSVGRLNAQKAYDVLIEAFARVAGKLPEWRLTIIGEGSARPRLEALIARLKLSGRVTLAGEVADPFPWFARAGVFVLASRHEGSPNALLEAMSCAAPAIVSDAVPDHERLTRGGKAARVVPAGDAAALAAAMAELAGDSRLRARLGGAAAEAVSSQKIETVAPLWERAVWD